MLQEFSNRNESTSETAAADAAAPTPAKEKESPKPETRLAFFTTIGTFILYLFGYLTLRFHLSAMGVATDLAVLDERYFLAGAQFLVYFLAAIPNALLPLLLVIPFRRRLKPVILRWLAEPNRVLLSAIAISVILIQFVIRKCLPFANLLLADELPDYPLIRSILLAETDALQSLYFSALVAAFLALAALLYLANRQSVRPSPLWNSLLALLLTIQFLFFPVTFGVLIANKDMPRVGNFDPKDPLKPNQQAWLIWQGASTATFFVRTWQQKNESTRKLIIIDNKKIEKLEITRYDRLLGLLF